MRGPSNFEVIERPSSQSHGVYDTIDEARGCVAYDRLRDFEIWQGDHIVEEGELQLVPMSSAKLSRIAEEIDRLNARVEDLVKEIRQGAHVNAAHIADALDEQCVSLACANDIVAEWLVDPESATEEHLNADAEQRVLSRRR